MGVAGSAGASGAEDVLGPGEHQVRGQLVSAVQVVLERGQLGLENLGVEDRLRENHL